MGNGETSSAQEPLVTIVVINHNYGRFLGACLDSVLRQTYPRIECILIDNASVDESRTVIRSYEDAFAKSSFSLQVILSDQNLYQTGSSILGFAHSTGSYVIFLDADDCLLDDGVETHIRAHLMSRVAIAFTAGDMYQTRGVDIVVATGKGLSDYVKSGRGQRKAFARPITERHFRLSRGEQANPLTVADLHLVKRSSQDWVWSPTSALCFRRAALTLMLSDYKPTMPTMTDTYLMRGTSALTGSLVIDRAVAVYRLHGGNLFGTEPALDNFCPYQRDKLKREEPAYISEILGCYAAIAPQLASCLFKPGIYFDAVRTVANSSNFVKATRYRVSSVAMEFLIRHRQLLIQAFGLRTYLLQMIISIRGGRDVVAAASTCIACATGQRGKQADSTTELDPVVLTQKNDVPSSVKNPKI